MRTKLFVTVESLRPGTLKEVKARWDVECILRSGKTVKRSSWISLKDASIKRAALVALKEALKIFNRATTMTVIIEEPTTRSILLNGWLTKWVRNNFTKKNGEIANVDLWKDIATLISPHYVTYLYGRSLEIEIDRIKEESWQ